MTYPLFTGNVWKIRLSCVKPSEKKQGKKIGKKIMVRGKKIKIGVEYIHLLQRTEYGDKSRLLLCLLQIFNTH